LVRLCEIDRAECALTKLVSENYIQYYLHAMRIYWTYTAAYPL